MVSRIPLPVTLAAALATFIARNDHPYPCNDPPVSIHLTTTHNKLSTLADAIFEDLIIAFTLIERSSLSEKLLRSWFEARFSLSGLGLVHEL
jgi:hypothetical protein